MAFEQQVYEPGLQEPVYLDDGSNGTYVDDTAPEGEGTPPETGLDSEGYFISRESPYADLKRHVDSDATLRGVITGLGSRKLQQELRERDKRLAAQEDTIRDLQREQNRLRFSGQTPEYMAKQLRDNPQYRQELADTLILEREAAKRSATPAPLPHVEQAVDDVNEMLLEARGYLPEARVREYEEAIAKGELSHLPPHQMFDAIKTRLTADIVLTRQSRAAQPRGQANQAAAANAPSPTVANQNLARLRNDPTARSGGAGRATGMSKAEWANLEPEQMEQFLRSTGVPSATEAFRVGLIR